MYCRHKHCLKAGTFHFGLIEKGLVNILLEAKDDDFGVVVWPLAHSEVQVTVDFLSCKKPQMMNLERRGGCESAQS